MKTIGSAFLFLFICSAFVLGQADKTDPRQYDTYVLDNIPIAKTPRYLGLNVEVMKYPVQTNLWDWMDVSNANIIRTPHPARYLRKKGDEINAAYGQVKTKKEFDKFRERIKKNPQREIIWDNYLFAEEIPWLGKPDEIVSTLTKNNKVCIFEMSYEPSAYQEPVLLKQTEGVEIKEDIINWSAAASAYEYYFACMYRYSSDKQVGYYMMRNEPPIDDKFVFQQFGALSKIAKQAMEDVKSILKDKTQAATLQLVGPAIYSAYEEYLEYNKDEIDILDVHFYDTGGNLFRKKLRRALMRARQNNLKLSLTEFGRIGGGMDIEQSLFSLNSSFQVADLLMEVLSVANPDDPGFEMALFYELQFPATHRNYKSLLYGDMNLVDWTGLDQAPWAVFPDEPTFEQLQLRYVTPAFNIFRMLARCTPGKEADSFKVYELMEANRGVTAVKDKRTGRNLWPDLSPEKYYANEGRSYKVKTIAVEGKNRLYVHFLNSEPTDLNNMRIDISSFGNKYTSAVIRETSLLKRDEPVGQAQVISGCIDINIPAESLTQVIFTTEDLSAISDIRIEEKTLTPGNTEKLGFLETTRLQVWGKSNDLWIDLSDLNIVYNAEKNTGIKAYCGGLIQRSINSEKQGKVTVKTLDGLHQAEIMIK